MSEKEPIARLVIKGNRFEVLIDAERALNYKLRRTPWSDKIVKIYQVWKDYKKGERASNELMMKFFSTKDPYQVSKRIIDEGELQIPANLRKRLIDEKRRAIMTLVSKVAFDPQTNFPIPLLRIEQAFESISFSVDPFKDPEEQLKPALLELKKVIPIKLKEAEMEITFTPDILGPISAFLGVFGEISRPPTKRGESMAVVVRVPEISRSTIAQKIGKRFDEKVKVSLL